MAGDLSRISLRLPVTCTIRLVRSVWVIAAIVITSCTRNDSTGAPTRPANDPPPPRVAAAVPQAAAVTETPGPTVRFVGRFDVSDPNAPRMAWPGSTIVT